MSTGAALVFRCRLAGAFAVDFVLAGAEEETPAAEAEAAVVSALSKAYGSTVRISNG